MKIIYLHQYFNTPSMSGGTRSYEMARRFVSYGHEVHVITSLRDESKHSTWITTHEMGISVHWFPIPYDNKMNFWARLQAFFSFALKAAKKAKEVGGDVVIATSTPLTIAIPGIITSKKLNIPMVFEVRDLWPEMPIVLGTLKNPLLKYFARKLELFAYHNAQAIIALSPGMKSGVVQTNYPSEKIAVIPNSSDKKLFRDINTEEKIDLDDNYPWLQDSPFIIYTGTCGKMNGVTYLAKLSKSLLDKSSDIRVLVVGGGGEYDEITNEAKQLGVLNMNFFMLPRLPKKEMPLLYKRATFVSSLFIDLKEMQSNSANKFFDGLAAGKPIIINYGGWQAELINKYRAGIVLWNKDLDEAAQLIIDAEKNNVYMNEMVKNSMMLADTYFDRDQLAQQFEKVLMYAVGKTSTFPSTISSGEYTK